jgi:hypothetical protein
MEVCKPEIEGVGVYLKVVGVVGVDSWDSESAFRKWASGTSKLEHMYSRTRTVTVGESERLRDGLAPSELR